MLVSYVCFIHFKHNMSCFVHFFVWYYFGCRGHWLVIISLVVLYSCCVFLVCLFLIRIAFGYICSMKCHSLFDMSVLISLLVSSICYFLLVIILFSFLIFIPFGYRGRFPRSRSSERREEGEVRVGEGLPICICVHACVCEYIYIYI